ncbi:MAG: retropepsin-like aspartic protease [Gammaproteobacteria bacterium]
MRRQARFFRLLPCVFWLASSLTLADDIQLALQQADSGNFYLHGTLDQTIETDMLVDTGSGYVSLSRKTFNRIRQLPGTEYARDIHGTMANGHTLRIPIYRVHELALGESCVLRDIEVAVFPGADRDILGLNALRRLQPFTMQMDPPALIASQCANLELSMSQ